MLSITLPARTHLVAQPDFLDHLRVDRVYTHGRVSFFAIQTQHFVLQGSACYGTDAHSVPPTMANEFDEFDDDLLDEETLLALDQAEKQHAVAITASQALPAASNSHRAATVPVQPVPQRQPNIDARAPQASQQQRAASARPIHQQQVARAVPPSQQQQRQQYALPQQQVIKTDPPHQYGNAAAGPSTSTYARKVVKPVYRDDFPNVDIDESGHRYKPRNNSVHAHSTSVNTSATNGVASRPGTDAEKEELKRQLASVGITYSSFLYFSTNSLTLSWYTATSVPRTRT